MQPVVTGATARAGDDEPAGHGPERIDIGSLGAGRVAARACTRPRRACTRRVHGCPGRLRTAAVPIARAVGEWQTQLLSHRRRPPHRGNLASRTRAAPHSRDANGGTSSDRHQTGPASSATGLQVPTWAIADNGTNTPVVHITVIVAIADNGSSVTALGRRRAGARGHGLSAFTSPRRGPPTTRPRPPHRAPTTSTPPQAHPAVSPARPSSALLPRPTQLTARSPAQTVSPTGVCKPPGPVGAETSPPQSQCLSGPRRSATEDGGDRSVGIDRISVALDGHTHRLARLMDVLQREAVVLDHREG